MTNAHNQQLSETLIRARSGPLDLVISTEPDLALRIDSEGRWLTLREGERFYRRLMEGSPVHFRHSGDDPQEVDAAEPVHDLARSLARRFIDHLGQDQTGVHLRGSATERGDLIRRLESVAGWTDRRCRLWQEQFARVYPEPVVILPPDRYQDLVLQPALGCPHGECSFCAFYQNKSFRILSDEEFARHMEGIQTLLGRALGLRDGIFLGSANALALPQSTLVARLRTVRQHFDVGKRQIAAFWDPDHSPTRSAAEWSALKEEGLVAVYAGLETGLPALRKKLGKSDCLEAFQEAVLVHRASDMHLGVIVLVGAGGPDYREAHREATVRLLTSLPWTAQDKIYLSPLTGGLPATQLEEELDAFSRRLKQSVGARVAPYHINRFRYFA